jgi:long-chain acyl-CoA synthetase
VSRDLHGAVAVRTIPEGETITFAALVEEWTALRRALAHLGVQQGAVVVSFVGNRPVFFPLILACLELGAALVPLGEATDAEAVALIHQAGATAIVTDRELPLRRGQEKTLGSTVRLLKLPDRADRHRDDRQTYGESVVLKLTSGSTHLPKAAIASELQLINDGRHIIEAMGIGPRDINLAYIPLSHSYAIGNIVMPLLWQGTGVALRQSFNPSQFVHDISVTGATVFPGVPFMFERVKSSETIDRLPPTLRLLITAGARIDSSTVLWFRQKLGRKVHSFYGSSETGGIAYDDSEDLSEPLHVGRAMPETTVTVRQPEAGVSAGRVFVSGNAVALGYAREEYDPVARFCHGGFLTGDLGYFDDRKQLVLTGRASALVNVAGRKVDPAEVERKLLELPGIADARVLGMACDRRGQQVVAFVVRADSALTPLAIRQLCAATLSTHKIPRRFVFVDRFPVDSRGKIDRRALSELASNADDG